MKIVGGIKYINEIRDLIIKYVNELNQDLSFQDIDHELTDLKAKYTGNNGKILVALVDQKTVGYYRHNQKRCEMKRLYVLPEYCNLKIGYNLIGKIIDLSKKEEYQETVLDAIKSLKSAVGLYEKFGFKEIPAYYNNPIDDIIYMMLEL